MLTILTPSYNRAALLGRLYRSLCNQTLKAFEWIIIDDGSTDNTESAVNDFLSELERGFDIIYYKRTNGGKHRAVNFGAGKARYEYCFIVDSDDYLLDNTIETVRNMIKTVDGNEKFAGVAGLKMYPEGRLVCQNAHSLDNKPYVDCTNLQRDMYGLIGDCAEIYRTKVLLKFPFPEFEGENFISEVSAWNEIAKAGLLIRWFLTPIYVCDYLSDGLSENITDRLSKNIKGYMYVVKQSIGCAKLYKREAIIGQFSYIVKKSGMKAREAAKQIGVNIFEFYVCYLVYRIKHIKK